MPKWPDVTLTISNFPSQDPNCIRIRGYIGIMEKKMETIGIMAIR